MLKKILLVTLLTSFAAPVNAYEGDFYTNEDIILNTEDVPVEMSQEETDAQYSEADETNALLQDRPRRRPRQPRYPRRQPRRSQWYFIGCTRTAYECDWAGFRRGYSQTRAQYDRFRCRNFYYPMACYIRR